MIISTPRCFCFELAVLLVAAVVLIVAKVCAAACPVEGDDCGGPYP